VVHSYNPSYLGDRDRGSWFEISLGKVRMMPISTNKLSMVVYGCNSSYWGCGSKCKPSPGKSKRDPIQNIIKAKRTGGMVQVVEHLSSKQKAPSSNPNIAKKKMATWVNPEW
jgi:hypothetical protein